MMAPIMKVEGHAGEVYSMKFANNGVYMATASRDRVRQRPPSPRPRSRRRARGHPPTRQSCADVTKAARGLLSHGNSLADD